MVKRVSLVAATVMMAAFAIVASAAARPTTVAASSLSCTKGVQIGMMAPITGPAASIGGDQLHWAQFFAQQWNKTHKLQLTIVQGDTQLDPAKASVVAQSMASNSSILAVIGPAGSQEVTASSPIL